jgi:hypothetical protein
MSIIIEVKASLLKCQRCDHTWPYKGKNEYVATCHHCRTYVTIKNHSVRPIDQDCEPEQSVEPSVVTNTEGVDNNGSYRATM